MDVGSLDELMLYVGDTTTVDVKGNFTGGVPLGLTYSAVSEDVRIAKATVADGSSEVMVTAEADGRIFITVTATDHGGASALQDLRVTVMPAADKPPPTTTPPTPTDDDAVAHRVRRAAGTGQDVRDRDRGNAIPRIRRSRSKVTVGPKGASETVWVVTG